jgi:hypothetical protein
VAKGSNPDLRNNCECASLHSVALRVDFVLPEGRKRYDGSVNSRKKNFFKKTDTYSILTHMYTQLILFQKDTF